MGTVRLRIQGCGFRVRLQRFKYALAGLTKGLGVSKC